MFIFFLLLFFLPSEDCTSSTIVTSIDSSSSVVIGDQATIQAKTFVPIGGIGFAPGDLYEFVPTGTGCLGAGQPHLSQNTAYGSQRFSSVSMATDGLTAGIGIFNTGASIIGSTDGALNFGVIHSGGFWHYSAGATGQYRVAGTCQGCCARSYFMWSYDNGKNWNQTDSVRCWTYVTVTDDGSIAIGSLANAGLRYTHDYGVSYAAPSGLGLVHAQALEISRHGHTAIVSYSSSPHGVSYSHDGGASWTASSGITTASTGFGLALSEDGTKVIIGQNSGYLYISTDSGVSFEQINSDWHFGGGTSQWHGLAVSSDFATIIAAQYSGNMWYSFNSGLNWTKDEALGTGKWREISGTPDLSKFIAGTYEDGGFYVNQVISMASLTRGNAYDLCFSSKGTEPYTVQSAVTPWIVVHGEPNTILTIDGSSTEIIDGAATIQGKTAAPITGTDLGPNDRYTFIISGTSCPTGLNAGTVVPASNQLEFSFVAAAQSYDLCYNLGGSTGLILQTTAQPWLTLETGFQNNPTIVGLVGLNSVLTISMSLEASEQVQCALVFGSSYSPNNATEVLNASIDDNYAVFSSLFSFSGAVIDNVTLVTPITGGDYTVYCATNTYFALAAGPSFTLPGFRYQIHTNIDGSVIIVNYTLFDTEDVVCALMTSASSVPSVSQVINSVQGSIYLDVSVPTNSIANTETLMPLTFDIGGSYRVHCATVSSEVLSSSDAFDFPGFTRAINATIDAFAVTVSINIQLSEDVHCALMAEGSVPASGAALISASVDADYLDLPGALSVVGGIDTTYSLSASLAGTVYDVYCATVTSEALSSMASVTTDQATVTFVADSLVSSEDGWTTYFSVALNLPPTSDVTITPQFDTTEATVSPNALIITPVDYTFSHLFALIGLDDKIVDGTVAYNVTFISSSADINYNTGLLPSFFQVFNQDNDLPEILTVTSGYVSEDGGQAIIAIRLANEPTQDVSVSFSSSNLQEAVLSISSITFTPSDWHTFRNISVIGQDDNYVDGDVLFSINFDPSTSLHTAYDGIIIPEIPFTNTDNDTESISFFSLETLSVNEAGSTDTFSVQLDYEPFDNVSLIFFSTDSSEVIVSPSSAIIEPQFWNVPVTVTLTGVDDDVVDGNVVVSIETELILSETVTVSGFGSVSVQCIDDDIASVVTTIIDTLCDEQGSRLASFQVVLTSEPEDLVNISIASTLTSEVIVVPSSRLVRFDSSNWNIAQTVQLIGVDDQIQDGNQTVTISVLSPVSLDTNYDGLDTTSAMISVINIDDDLAGFNVFPLTDLFTIELTSSAYFSIELTSEPTADVSLTLLSSDTTEVTVLPASITFTATSWNVSQTIAVNNVFDAVQDGDQAFSIVVSPASSVDLVYDALDPTDPTGVNYDAFYGNAISNAESLASQLPTIQDIDEFGVAIGLNLAQLDLDANSVEAVANVTQAQLSDALVQREAVRTNILQAIESLPNTIQSTDLSTESIVNQQLESMEEVLSTPLEISSEGRDTVSTIIDDILVQAEGEIAEITNANAAAPITDSLNTTTLLNCAALSWESADLDYVQPISSNLSSVHDSLRQTQVNDGGRSMERVAKRLTRVIMDREMALANASLNDLDLDLRVNVDSSSISASFMRKSVANYISNPVSISRGANNAQFTFPNGLARAWNVRSSSLDAVITMLDGKVKYRGAIELPQVENGTIVLGKTINISPVFSFTFYDREAREEVNINLPEDETPITIVVEHQDVAPSTYIKQCRWFGQPDKWLTGGCRVADSNSSGYNHSRVTICECTHLTSFQIGGVEALESFSVNTLSAEDFNRVSASAIADNPLPLGVCLALFTVFVLLWLLALRLDKVLGIAYMSQVDHKGRKLKDRAMIIRRRLLRDQKKAEQDEGEEDLAYFKRLCWHSCIRYHRFFAMVYRDPISRHTTVQRLSLIMVMCYTSTAANALFFNSSIVSWLQLFLKSFISAACALAPVFLAQFIFTHRHHKYHSRDIARAKSRMKKKEMEQKKLKAVLNGSNKKIRTVSIIPVGGRISSTSDRGPRGSFQFGDDLSSSSISDSDSDLDSIDFDLWGRGREDHPGGIVDPDDNDCTNWICCRAYRCVDGIRLPHCLLYVNYMFIIMLALVASYVIIVFGVKFDEGETESNDYPATSQWLLASGLSILQQICINEPVQVFLITMFFFTQEKARQSRLETLTKAPVESRFVVRQRLRRMQNANDNGGDDIPSRKIKNNTSSTVTHTSQNTNDQANKGDHHHAHSEMDRHNIVVSEHEDALDAEPEGHLRNGGVDAGYLPVVHANGGTSSKNGVHINRHLLHLPIAQADHDGGDGDKFNNRASAAISQHRRKERGSVTDAYVHDMNTPIIDNISTQPVYAPQAPLVASILGSDMPALTPDVNAILRGLQQTPNSSNYNSNKSTIAVHLPDQRHDETTNNTLHLPPQSVYLPSSNTSSQSTLDTHRYQNDTSRRFRSLLKLDPSRRG